MRADCLPHNAFGRGRVRRQRRGIDKGEGRGEPLREGGSGRDRRVSQVAVAFATLLQPEPRPVPQRVGDEYIDGGGGHLGRDPGEAVPVAPVEDGFGDSEGASTKVREEESLRHTTTTRTATGTATCRRRVHRRRRRPPALVQKGSGRQTRYGLRHRDGGDGSRAAVRCSAAKGHRSNELASWQRTGPDRSVGKRGSLAAEFDLSRAGCPLLRPPDSLRVAPSRWW
jgi:hypothetical protein